MNIYYRRTFGYFFTIAGSILLILRSITFLQSGDFSPTILTGCLLLIVGYCQFSNPYFSFDRHSLTVYNALGSIDREYQFSSIKNLEVEKDNIYARINGQKQQIPIAKFLIQNSDWDKLLEKIASEKEKAVKLDRIF